MEQKILNDLLNQNPQFKNWKISYIYFVDGGNKNIKVHLGIKNPKTHKEIYFTKDFNMLYLGIGE